MSLLGSDREAAGHVQASRPGVTGAAKDCRTVFLVITVSNSRSPRGNSGGHIDFTGKFLWGEFMRFVVVLFLGLILFLKNAEAAPPICDAAMEGTIVYNKDYSTMVFCNGANWIGMGGGSSSTAWGDLTSVPTGFADGVDDTGGGVSALPSSQIFVGNASNAATAVALSGDATITNAGVLNIASGAIIGPEIADGSINSARIADGTVSNTDLAGSIALSKLLIAGTPDGTKFLKDDGTWATVAGGGGGGGPSGCSTPGSTCADGTKYAGSYSGWFYFVTPADNSTGQNWSSAMTNCDNLTANGKTDWVLPTLGALEMLYNNKDVITAFSATYYWSASQTDGGNAWGINFANGDHNGYDESDGNRVRCVRRS